MSDNMETNGVNIESLFNAIDDIYCEHDGGEIHLSEDRKNRVKRLLSQANGQLESTSSLPIDNVSILVCHNCGSQWVVKTYDGHWCKNCKTEL